MRVIKDNSGSDSDKIAEALDAIRNIPKNDMDLIATLAADQKRRKILSFVNILLVVMTIASAYLILRYDVYQRIFTPKRYWANEVRSLENLVNQMEEAYSKMRNDQATWQRTYDDELEKMVSGLQKTGMDRDNSIKKAKEIMQSLTQSRQEASDNVRSVLSQFKRDLEVAKQELTKHEKRE